MKALTIIFLFLSLMSFVEDDDSCFETTMLIAYYDGEIVGAEKDSSTKAAGRQGGTSSMFLQTNKFSSDETLELIINHEWETSSVYRGYISKIVQITGEEEVIYNFSSGLDLVISSENVCISLIQDMD